MFPWILLRIGCWVRSVRNTRKGKVGSSGSKKPTKKSSVMLNIPILSRLNFSDYFSLIYAVGILIIERIIRIIVFFIPASVLQHIRINLISRFIYGDEDGDSKSEEELKRFTMRNRNAKELVENLPGFEGRYKLEEHAVFTPDGYILILHRLRFSSIYVSKDSNFGDGLYECRGGDDRPPVLLNHGAMMTSEAWLAAPHRFIRENDSEKIPATLAHVLLHAGYDVWLANRRGNKYSCKHTTLSTHDQEFWSFSLDEPACRDLPAVVDFIRESTDFERVNLIGFSQGAAEALAALSMVRGLEKKVNFAVLLAPTTKPGVNGFKAAIIRTIVKMSPETVFLFFGRRIMLSFVPFWQRLFSPKTFVFFLDTSMKWMFGWHCRNMRFEDKMIHYQHLFSYTSVKQIVHWFQIMRARRFQMFDESPAVKVASGHIPPAYPLMQIRTPLVLFEGTEDSLYDASLKHLPSLVGRHDIEGYEHLDFLWAESACELVWPEVLKHLNRLNFVDVDDRAVKAAINIRKQPLSPPPESEEQELMEAFRLFLKKHKA